MAGQTLLGIGNDGLLGEPDEVPVRTPGWPLAQIQTARMTYYGFYGLRWQVVGDCGNDLRPKVRVKKPILRFAPFTGVEASSLIS